MSERMHSQVTTERALHQACLRERPCRPIIFHSDQGIQYAAENFRKALCRYSFVQSMSHKGVNTGLFFPDFTGLRFPLFHVN
jgi:putative transposase